MQQLCSLSALIGRHPGPVGASRFAGGHGTRSRRHAVQDRLIEQRVNNLMVGHSGPLLNTPNLTDRVRQVAFDRIAVLNGKAA